MNKVIRKKLISKLFIKTSSNSSSQTMAQLFGFDPCGLVADIVSLGVSIAGMIPAIGVPADAANLIRNIYGLKMVIVPNLLMKMTTNYNNGKSKVKVSLYS